MPVIVCARPQSQSTIHHRPSTIHSILLSARPEYQSAVYPRLPTPKEKGTYLPACLPLLPRSSVLHTIASNQEIKHLLKCKRHATYLPLHLLLHITSTFAQTRAVGCCIQASAFCKPAAPHRTATQLGPPLNLQPKPRTRHFSTLYLPNYLPIAATHPTPIYHHHHYHQPPFCLSRPDPNLIWPLLGFNLSRFVLHHLATLAPLPGCFFSYFGLHPRPCEAQ